MARPVSGTVKTSQVKVKQKNGDIYVLERKSVYDPEKGYTKSLNRSCGGHSSTSWIDANSSVDR